MGFYKFKREDAIRFARFKGIKTYEDKKGELQFQKCPYCGETTKDTYTFSINLETGAFNCKRESCGRKGSFYELAKDCGFDLGKDVRDYESRKDKSLFRNLYQPKEPIKPTQSAIAYLKSRGIGEAVATKYEIHTLYGHENELIFPFYDEKGKLVNMKYRNMEFLKGRDPWKEKFEQGCKPILFGMKQCDTSSHTLIITEGQIDSLSCVEAGYGNAVSVPGGANGFTWVPYCWDWVIKNFDTIIVFGDHEHGHITLLDAIQSRFDEKGIKCVRTEDYKDCKDANDILRKYGKDQIKTCIENAEYIPVKEVTELADVGEIDIFSVPKLKTGIRSLDAMLYGGLPFGGVTLISGKPGEGKSTLASQILIQAASQGYRCFAYSGELTAELFKAWMNFQVAGKKHIYTNTNIFGDKVYGISDVNKHEISEWYRGKIDLYDYSVVSDEPEKEGIVEVCKKEIIRKGVSVILVDNLMTALDLEAISEQDKYERQSKFMKKLVLLAKTMNCLILLVAHKRKNNYSTNANDEISGSGDISNLAMVTLSYEKTEDRDSPDRLLKVAKNRLFGKTSTDGWIMHFDEPSKRIYGDNDDPDFEVGWDKGIIDGTTPVSEEDADLFT